MNRRLFLRVMAAGPLAAAAAASARAQVEREFDFIVVGAGSSGCVVANRLSADRSVSVLLVEAGQSAAADEAVATPGRWVSLLGGGRDWSYAIEPDAGLGGRSIRWPRGRAIGGSSAINAMAYVRGDAACYDAWGRAAGPMWNYRALEDHFAAVEREMTIAEARDPHDGHAVFVAAAKEIGLDALYYRKCIRNGRRESAADAFLTPVLARTNLAVSPDTSVRKIIVERNRAVGIEIERDGRVEQFRARREVVLCAGVIGSPKLLMLSGIGPASLLRAHGIAVVADSPNVGTNLHDHPRVSVRWKSLKTLAPSTTSAGLFARSSEGTAVANLQFYVGRGLDAPDDFITLTVAQSQPRSRGSIILRSADPAATPVITANYFADAADLDDLVAGVRLARRIAAASAYRGLIGDAVDPPASTQSDDAMRTWIRGAADTIFHPVGTCRMGRAPEAVVDPELRVRGVERLRVADASIMPVVVNSQTNAACLMIGARVAHLMMEV